MTKKRLRPDIECAKVCNNQITAATLKVMNFGNFQLFLIWKPKFITNYKVVGEIFSEGTSHHPNKIQSNLKINSATTKPSRMEKNWVF